MKWRIFEFNCLSQRHKCLKTILFCFSWIWYCRRWSRWLPLKQSWPLFSLTFFFFSLHLLLFTHFGDTQKAKFYSGPHIFAYLEGKYYNFFSLKRFFTKVDFRAIFLLFTASVRSRSLDQQSYTNFIKSFKGLNHELILHGLCQNQTQTPYQIPNPKISNLQSHSEPFIITMDWWKRHHTATTTGTTIAVTAATVDTKTKRMCIRLS